MQLNGQFIFFLLVSVQIHHWILRKNCTEFNFFCYENSSSRFKINTQISTSVASGQIVFSFFSRSWPQGRDPATGPAPLALERAPHPRLLGRVRIPSLVRLRPLYGPEPLPGLRPLDRARSEPSGRGLRLRAPEGQSRPGQGGGRPQEAVSGRGGGALAGGEPRHPGRVHLRAAAGTAGLAQVGPEVMPEPGGLRQHPRGQAGLGTGIRQGTEPGRAASSARQKIALLLLVYLEVLPSLKSTGSNCLLYYSKFGAAFFAGKASPSVASVATGAQSDGRKEVIKIIGRAIFE